MLASAAKLMSSANRQERPLARLQKPDVWPDLCYVQSRALVTTAPDPRRALRRLVGDDGGTSAAERITANDESLKGSTANRGAKRGAMKIAAAVLALVVAYALPAWADDQPPHPRDRAEATEVVRNLRRIVTPDGIEETRTVRVGGIDQFVTIRGQDRRNPVLLVLHGGPGYVQTPFAWWYSHPWEEYFTVVEWDQRGAGKTYLLNDPKAVDPTLTPKRMNADVDEMVQFLRKHLGKQKIFAVGNSWGSYLGIELAHRHPEWLHAYIGVGQVASAPESERRGYTFALAQAKRRAIKRPSPS